MFIKPLENLVITSKFGPRVDPITKKANSFHSGIDLRAAVNTPILAIADGVVEISKTNNGGAQKGYGHYLVVQHNGFYVLCAHLAKLGLPVGTRVKAGQEIGRTGNTGNSTGPHLHFEVRTGKVNGQSFTKDKNGMMPGAVDPEKFVIEPEWQSILRLAAKSPEKWIKFVEEHSNDPLGKFLPELILNIKNLK